MPSHGGYVDRRHKRSSEATAEIGMLANRCLPPQFKTILTRPIVWSSRDGESAPRHKWSDFWHGRVGHLGWDKGCGRRKGLSSSGHQPLIEDLLAAGSELGTPTPTPNPSSHHS